MLRAGGAECSSHCSYGGSRCTRLYVSPITSCSLQRRFDSTEALQPNSEQTFTDLLNKHNLYLPTCQEGRDTGKRAGVVWSYLSGDGDQKPWTTEVGFCRLVVLLMDGHQDVIDEVTMQDIIVQLPHATRALNLGKTARAKKFAEHVEADRVLTGKTERHRRLRRSD